MQGGSWVSTGNETSRFTRFGFRRHFFQHAGFRYVRSSNPTPVRLCKAEIYLPGSGVIGKLYAPLQCITATDGFRGNCELYPEACYVAVSIQSLFIPHTHAHTCNTHTTYTCNTHTHNIRTTHTQHMHNTHDRTLPSIFALSPAMSS